MGRIMTQSATTAAPVLSRVTPGVSLAVLGQALFLAGAWMLPVVTGTDAVRDRISDLVLGPYGYVQTAAYLISGLGLVALAGLLRAQLTPGPSRSPGVMLIMIAGIGAILSGVLQPVASSGSGDLWSLLSIGSIHATLNLASSIAMLLGMLVLTWAFSFDPEWDVLTLASAFLSGAALTFIVVQSGVPVVGLLQRCQATVVGIWVILVAFNTLRMASPYRRRNI